MTGLSKIASKTSAATLALMFGLSMMDIRPANAQACDPPGAAAVAAAGTIVPQILTEATNIISGIASSFTQFIGPVTSALSTVGGIAGGCIDLTSCMQMYFSQLSATNTNTQTMNASVSAKGDDYLATNQYALQLQTQQSQMAINNGVGTSAGNNSLAYMNNPECVPATLSTGLTQADVEREQAATYDPPAGGPAADPSSNPPGNSDARLASISSVQRINKYYAMDKSNFGATSANPYLDTNVFTLLDPDTLAYTPIQTQADNLYISYIVGLPPEVPPASATDSAGQQATVAQLEKLAYYNTSELAFKQDQALRKPETNAASAAVNAIFQAAQITPPVTTNGKTSMAAMLDAMYAQPVEDPNSIINISGLGVETKALQYIAVQELLANYLSYQRYLIEKENLEVNSAALALASRQANFTAHP